MEECIEYANGYTYMATECPVAGSLFHCYRGNSLQVDSADILRDGDCFGQLTHNIGNGMSNTHCNGFPNSGMYKMEYGGKMFPLGGWYRAAVWKVSDVVSMIPFTCYHAKPDRPMREHTTVQTMEECIEYANGYTYMATECPVAGSLFHCYRGNSLQVDSADILRDGDCFGQLTHNIGNGMSNTHCNGFPNSGMYKMEYRGKMFPLGGWYRAAVWKVKDVVSIRCENTNNGGRDTYGDDCTWYDRNLWGCEVLYWNDEDFNNKEMCCACGGGRWV